MFGKAAQADPGNFRPDGSRVYFTVDRQVSQQEHPGSPGVPEQPDSTSEGTTSDSSDAAKEESESRKAPRRTIAIAVGIGLLATCAMIVWIVFDQMNSFTGSEQIVQLLDSANTLKGDEFEAVDAAATDVEDWFFLKHGLEHLSVPPQFKDARTVGCRVFKFNGAAIGQVMAVNPTEMLFYLFPADQVGVKVHDGEWRIVENDRWVGAITGVKNTAFLVAIRGKRQDMEKILARK
jgi:hypothetical protein